MQLWERVQAKTETPLYFKLEQGGVSNTIMGNISRDEIMKIAENVF